MTKSILLPLLSFGNDQQFSVYWFLLWLHRVVRVLLLGLTRMFPFFNVGRPGQLSSTHLKYFTSFFVLYLTYSCPLCSYLNPVLHGNGLTFAITCTVEQYFGQSAVQKHVCICAGAGLLHVQFYLRFLYTRFPHLPIPLLAQFIWCTLHAISITCAIHTPKMTIIYPQFH